MMGIKIEFKLFKCIANGQKCNDKAVSVAKSLRAPVSLQAAAALGENGLWIMHAQKRYK